MTLTYGFYNSVTGDRVYNAIQMSSIFDGIIENGVYATIGEYFFVSPDTGMNLLVGTGRAWFDHTWTYNDAPISVVIDTADPLLPRIDAVILEIDASEGVRANSVKVIEGTPASSPVPPTLTNGGTLHQYPLAYVLVGVGVTVINAGDITNKVGTSDCPFVTGPISVIDFDDLVAQFHGEWHEWFDFVVDELSEEQFGNLQNQINSHNHSEPLNTQVVTGGIEDLAVTLAKLAADSVDDSKIQYRVPTLAKRQGADSNNWNDGQGSSSDYTLTNVKMEVGVKDIIIANGFDNGSTTVTFPTAFAYIPLVFVTLASSADCRAIITSLSTTSVTIRVYRSSTSGSLDVSISWLAVGPE